MNSENVFVYLQVPAGCKCSMADDNNVPPLEDMSSVLDQILSSRDIKNDNSSSNRRPVVASSGISIADSCTGDGRNSSAVCVIRYF